MSEKGESGPPLDPPLSMDKDTGVGSGRYAGDLTPQLFMWGIDMYIPPPLEKSNT